MPDGSSNRQFYTVCRSGPPACDTATIQEAVDQAADGDEIRIATGTYTSLTFRSGITQVVYLTRSVTLRGGFTTTDWLNPDPTANPTRLDAGGKGRVVYMRGDVTVHLEGLELIGGDAIGLGGDPLDAGGGLAVISGTVVLEESRVFSNTARIGGGLFVLEGHPIISGSVILSNSAAAGGGLSLYRCTDSMVTGNLIAGNEASGTEYDEGGGGLYLLGGDAILVGNVISANTGGYGGGGWYGSGNDATVIDTEVRDNTAGEYGGGLFVRGGAMHCRGSTIAGNSAGGYGGGMGLRWTEVTLHGNLIEDNEAEGGGGIEAYYQTHITLTKNAIIGNRATFDCGGGGHFATAIAWASGNLVSGNQAKQNGGGLAFCYGEAVLDGNTVMSNTAATGAGGGLYFSHSQGTLDATILRGNDAVNGGGLGLRETSTVETDNALVVENGASADGGGFYVESSSIEALHTTLARNNSRSGVCVTRHAGEGSSATLVNTILVSHTLAVTVSEGSHASLDGTLWGADAWANGRDSDGDGTVITGTLNLRQEPGFVDGDYYLALNSAAIDTGIDTEVSRDVQGQPRPHYDGYDLGADEWWPVAVIKRATPSIVDRGDVVTYAIRLTNTTELTAPISLTDPLPAEVGFVGPLLMSHGQGGYAAGSITWTGTLAPTGSGWLEWTVSILPATPYSTTITNRAQVRDPFGTYLTEGAQTYLPPWQVYFPVALR
jgi:uncharacterized repeat protein (TIGR01451 family)